VKKAALANEPAGLCGLGFAERNSIYILSLTSWSYFIFLIVRLVCDLQFFLSCLTYLISQFVLLTV
jgi:hypothetical protein